MSATRTSIRVLLLCLVISHSAHAQIVVEDDGVSVSRGELEYLVGNWPSQMQRAAANDEGDRFELLNKVIMLEKMAAAADNLSPETEAYWQLLNKVLIVKRDFILDNFTTKLKIPDMSALAAERYETQKRKYAFVSEKRMSSHILFVCAPPCSAEDVSAEAQGVLDELEAGADFSDMVQAHSDDQSTAAKAGKVDRWITNGEREVPPRYSKALFQIESVGGYSELVGTKFGIHIIRYDGTEEERFLTYGEAKPLIVADLTAEYRKLSTLEFIAQFNITDDAFIDGDAMEKIFAPYKAADD